MLHGYHIIEELGRGGFGKVVLAEEELSGRKVAIKHLKASTAIQVELLHEIKIISQFYHPNIVTYHNAFTDKETIYFVMEYCSGGSLARILPSQLLPEKKVTKLILGIAEALNTVHQKGITHNDIKPANLLLAESGIIKLADFGVANGQGATSIYLPPDNDSEEYTNVDLDIFALGITYTELLTGRHPLIGLSQTEAIALIKSGNFKLNQFPGYVHDIIHKATNPDKEERFQNMQEFIDALSANVTDIVIDKTHIRASKFAKKLKTLLNFKRYYSFDQAINRGDQSLMQYPIVQQQIGNFHIAMNNIELADKVFNNLKEKLPTISIYKQLGFINLELGRYTEAIGYLTKHLATKPEDIEVYNNLLESYYKNKNFKKGMYVSSELTKTFPKEICFASNYYLFQQLYQGFDEIQPIKKNAYIHYNYNIFLQGKRIINEKRRDNLLHKLLFCHYNLTKAKANNDLLTISVNNAELDYIPIGYITIGRTGYENDIEFDGTLISRKHCLIFALKNENWIYNLDSTTGTFVDDKRISNRMRLTHKHIIKIGDNELIVNVDRNKMF